MYGFEPPKVIRSEIWATLPEKYRSEGAGPRSPTRASKTGTTLEGPSFDREGNLYCVDIPNSRIFRITPDKEVTLVAEYEGEPNGLKIHKDGRIFIADHHHGLMLLDPKAGSVKVVCSGYEKERFKGLNDLVFASNGDLYMTDQGATGLHDPTGRVVRLRATGELDIICDTIPSPNGIALHANEKIVYVAVTRASAVWHLPMTRMGGLVKVGLFAQLPCPAPDGMAMDAEGNLAVAAPGLGVVWVYDRHGLPIYKVESAGGHHLTNLAYGGPGNRYLYMTEGDSFSILRAEMPVPGRPMYSHA
jgi:gluconolactonase